MARHLRRLAFLPLLALLVAPAFADAATLDAHRSVTFSDSAPDNAYVAGGTVTVTGPVAGDLSAAGGTVATYSHVNGDALAIGGTVLIAKPVDGDVRAIGGRVTVNASTTGDVLAIGGTADVTGTAGDIVAVGSDVDLAASTTGDVSAYGADVTLAGYYGGNVTVVASNRFSIAPGTHIAGTLHYKAPQQVSLPANARVEGGASYTGSYAYVPTSEQVRRYAVAGAAIFFVVRALAGVIVAGLIAGLFPAFAIAVNDRALVGRPRRAILLGLLGFALAVATPILIVLLFLSFVGVGVALIVGALYALLVFLSYAFTGIIVGAFLRHAVLYRLRGVTDFSWQDAVLGTLVVHAVELIPTVGFALVCIMAALAAGAIASLAYTYAFRSEYSYDIDYD